VRQLYPVNGTLADKSAPKLPVTAAQHALEASPVRISVARGGVHVSVSDEGWGIGNGSAGQEESSAGQRV